METKHLQILKPFARTCSKRSTMPILDYLFVENNVLTATDLETWLTIPVQLPNGMYTIINNEFFKQEAKAEDFPLYPELDKEYKKTQQLTLTPGYDASPEALANITASTANDELRPVMNGVFFDNENMVASDAHVLRMVPVNENQKAAEINFISPVPQVLVSMLRKYSDSHVTVTKYEHKEKQTYKGGYITYEFPEGVTIAVREVEGLYPNYKSVCPKVEKYKRALSLSTTQAAEIIKFTKAIDKEAGRIYFNETTPSAKDQDLTVEKVFDPVNTDNIPDRQYDGLIMPMMPGEKDKGSTENLFIINASRFEAITKGHRGKITLAVEDCSRAILVWLTPEKQKAAGKKRPVKTKQTNAKTHPYSGQRFITRFGEKGYSIIDQLTAQVIFTGTHKTGDDAKQIALLLNEPTKATQWLKTKPLTPQPTSNQQPATRNHQVKRIIWQAA